MRCADCRWDYPENLLSQMFVGAVAGKGGYTGYICGICALNRANAIHGIQLTKFTGRMAEANRQAAIMWRNNHPVDGPIGANNA